MKMDMYSYMKSLLYSIIFICFISPTYHFPDIFICIQENEANGINTSGSGTSALTMASSASGTAGTATQYVTSWSAMAGILFAIIACTWAVIALSLQ